MKGRRAFSAPSFFPRRSRDVIPRRFSTYRRWPGAESNRRHADFQSAALPSELPGRTMRRKNLARPGKRWEYQRCIPFCEPTERLGSPRRAASRLWARRTHSHRTPCASSSATGEPPTPSSPAASTNRLLRGAGRYERRRRQHRPSVELRACVRRSGRCDSARRHRVVPRGHVHGL